MADLKLRNQLEAMLRDGLATEWQDRGDTSEAVNHIVARLQQVPAGNHADLLRIGGFTLQPPPTAEDDIAQTCETCMYYKTHDEFCELPELMLPVKAAWSCRLWRI